MPWLFLLFIVLPLTEIVILIQVGQLIGAWYTVGLVLLSAFIGVNLLRQQGLSTLLRARQRLDQGELPATEMVEGIILAVGGALLVTPGFVTDCIGFSCLIPPIRRRLVREVQKRARVVVATHAAGAGPAEDFRHAPRGGDVIEGDYRREE